MKNMLELTQNEADIINSYPTGNVFLDANDKLVVPEELLTDPIFQDEWPWLSQCPVIPWAQPTLAQAIARNP